jgi:hypothetical protein
MSGAASAADLPVKELPAPVVIPTYNSLPETRERPAISAVANGTEFVVCAKMMSGGSHDAAAPEPNGLDHLPRCPSIPVPCRLTTCLPLQSGVLGPTKGNSSFPKCPGTGPQPWFGTTTPRVRLVINTTTMVPRGEPE